MTLRLVGDWKSNGSNLMSPEKSFWNLLKPVSRTSSSLSLTHTHTLVHPLTNTLSHSYCLECCINNVFKFSTLAHKQANKLLAISLSRYRTHILCLSLSLLLTAALLFSLSLSLFLTPTPTNTFSLSHCQVQPV